MEYPPILDSAYRHGVGEADIRAAYNAPIAVYVDQGDLDLTMHVGFGADGNSLYEVGFARVSGPADTLVIDAMAARPKHIPRRGR